MFLWVIPDLNPCDLTLWVVDFKGGPSGSRIATLGSISKSECEIISILTFFDREEIVVIAELLDCGKVSYIMLQVKLGWSDKFRVSEAEFVGILILEHVSEDT